MIDFEEITCPIALSKVKVHNRLTISLVMHEDNLVLEVSLVKSPNTPNNLFSSLESVAIRYAKSANYGIVVLFYEQT